MLMLSVECAFLVLSKALKTGMKACKREFTRASYPAWSQLTLRVGEFMHFQT